jgi:hypothetical protein
MRVTKTSVIADVMETVVVMFGLFSVLLVDVIVLADVMVAQHQLQVAMLVAPISLAPQGMRRRIWPLYFRTRVLNALWESFHLRLVSARALPVQLVRTRTSLDLLFARCARRESLQV